MFDLREPHFTVAEFESGLNLTYDVTPDILWHEFGVRTTKRSRSVRDCDVVPIPQSDTSRVTEDLTFNGCRVACLHRHPRVCPSTRWPASSQPATSAHVIILLKACPRLALGGIRPTIHFLSQIAAPDGAAQIRSSKKSRGGANTPAPPAKCGRPPAIINRVKETLWQAVGARPLP